MKPILCWVSIVLSTGAFSQNSSNISGTIQFDGKPVSHALVTLDSSQKTLSDTTGNFIITNVKPGRYILRVWQENVCRFTKKITLSKTNLPLHITLYTGSVEELDEVYLKQNMHLNNQGRLEGIRGTAIFEAKKNDVVVLKNLDANLATNNARQVFAKVAGINVWENDGSGIQLNVSSRGLSPNRSWEFNMRQNEYDIAADILGYPDMYYSPPMDAVSYIEVVKGSASLQYGTQMGGLLNFVLKEGNPTKPIEVEAKQTMGSYGMFSSYNSIGGTKGKWSYFGYYDHRTGDGWRENANYKYNTGYVSATYNANDRLKIKAEFTRMEYLLRLSAGLTDSAFAVNPQKSIRNRNWFRIQWNIPSVRLDYKISAHTSVSITSYVLLANRNSLENTKPVNIIADTGYRDIRNDQYKNFGTEIRFLSQYKLNRNISGIITGGIRGYTGRTIRGQGWGTKESDPNFSFIHPDNLEYSDYIFRNRNLAFFAENVFKLGKLSIVPGLRYELIQFLADGYFNTPNGKVEERGINSNRNFPLMGTGAEYKLNAETSIYANYTQSYRSANFNDIRITSPNVVIDPNLKDSKGYNIDLGIRGKYKGFLSFDVNAFYLQYNNRIGLVSRTNASGNTILYSTNIADSRNMGIESFMELNVLKALNVSSPNSLLWFVSYAYTDAKYLRSEKDMLKGKKVETAPSHILRTGLSYKLNRFSTTLNYSYTSSQFSDANNTVFSSNGNSGIVPAYYVMDWSSRFTFRPFKLGFTINNLTNNTYFTRRATAYPGPGLIPAEPLFFQLSIEVRL